MTENISHKDYKNLDVWKESMSLAKMIYMLTNDFPGDEKFGLSSQIKRSAISIPSNIAEGIGRNSKKDTRQFFYISKGSLYELETQVYLSKELGFATDEQITPVINQLVTVRKLIIGFIKYLDR